MRGASPPGTWPERTRLCNAIEQRFLQSGQVLDFPVDDAHFVRQQRGDSGGRRVGTPKRGQVLPDASRLSPVSDAKVPICMGFPRIVLDHGAYSTRTLELPINEPKTDPQMIQPPQYRRIVQTSAWYDLIVTLGFATPWTFAAIHAMLMATAQGLPGTFPPFEAAHVLMANLLGSIVTIWAILRIRDPQLQFGRYDAAGRFLFAAWQIYAVVHGASVIILGFTVFEILFGIVQSLPVARPAPRP